MKDSEKWNNVDKTIKTVKSIIEAGKEWIDFIEKI